MIKNKHKESDVVAGAGFGILLANLAYLTHSNRWGREATDRGTGKLSLEPRLDPRRRHRIRLYLAGPLVRSPTPTGPSQGTGKTKSVNDGMFPSVFLIPCYKHF